MRSAIAIGAVCVGLLAVAVSGAPASSSEKKIATYCSTSGDVCYGIFDRAGKVYLRITTAAKYFKRYTLCVRLLPAGAGAEHALRCRTFPLVGQAGSTWGSTVRYARQFPITQRGRYRVTWKLQQPLGPPLYFRLPR